MKARTEIGFTPLTRVTPNTLTWSAVRTLRQEKSTSPSPSSCLFHKLCPRNEQRTPRNCQCHSWSRCRVGCRILCAVHVFFHQRKIIISYLMKCLSVFPNPDHTVCTTPRPALTRTASAISKRSTARRLTAAAKKRSATNTTEVAS